MRQTIALGIVAIVAAGCQTASDPDRLLGSSGGTPTNALASDSLGAGRHNTPNHMLDPNLGYNGLADPDQIQVQVQRVGSPEAVARLHGCSKLTYAALGAALASWGIDLTNTTPGSAGELYADGASALGVAIYSGRMPEAILGSTASLAKQMDIFVAAAGEILSAGASMPACPGTALFDSLGNFTSDGVSCVIGKPATHDYIALANQVVHEATDQDSGRQLALSTLLEASHTCE